MASLKDIRKRIASVKNTQQITKAMKMVAAAKLRRAQDAATAARPYAERLEALLGQVAERSVDPEAPPPHPLLARREPIRRVELVVMTSDRGLCGGFNSNIIRRAQRFLYEHADDYQEIVVSTIGRKGRDFFRRRPVAHGQHHEDVFTQLSYQQAETIADGLTERFLGRDLDAVFLLYNKFRSVIAQEVTLLQLLPIEAPAIESEGAEGLAAIDYKYEPSRDEVLETLLPKYLATQVWRALLESQASEHGARMTAMDNATRNAGEMIETLTLVANRTRQAAITTELMEIVSGAEALK